MENRISQTASTVPRRISSSTWVDRLARYGLVAKGVSYGLVGVLAPTAGSARPAEPRRDERPTPPTE